MGRIKTITRGLLALLLVAACNGAYAQDATAEILRRLDEMQKRIDEQQKTIDALRQKLEQQQPGTPAEGESLSALVKKEVEAAVAEGRADGKEGPTLALGSGIEGLKLQGDLRLRYERREEEKNGDSNREKSRFRTRLRLGGVWTNPAENWEIGVGLATGQTSGDSGSSSGKSTNDSWGSDSAFESGTIFLDYAYAKHSWKDYGLSLTVGQQKNPFTTSFILWDGDLRPTGGTLQWENDNFFATAGAYNLRGDNYHEDGGSKDMQELANMYAGQVGYKIRTERLEGLVAAGYYHYDDQTTEYYIAGDADDDYAWQIADLYGELGGKIGPVGLTAYSHVAYNLGADDGAYSSLGGLENADGKSSGAYGADGSYDPEDNNLAYVIGLDAKYGKFKAGYAWAHIEGDSVPYFLSDSDFGAPLISDNSVNVEGHRISLAYKVTKNCEVAGTVTLTDWIEPPAQAGDTSGSLYQLDLKYKF